MSTNLRPLGLLGSILFTAIPGLLCIGTIRYGVPWAMGAGISQLVAFHIALYAPCALLGLTAVLSYRWEGNPMQWTAFRERMRLGSMSRRLWLITGAVTLLVLILEDLLSPGQLILAELPLFAPPDWLAAPFNPLEPFELPLSHFMGTELAGQYWIPVAYVPCLLANILGEELLWRGYLLPRQELAFGKWAWLVNGLCWILLFHMFLPWIFMTIIPSMVLVPWLAQRQKSTVSAIVIHGTGNTLLLVLLIAGVLQ